MSKQAIRERLAAIEHERWADWQRWVHQQCLRDMDGSLMIPAELVGRWERQINTPYDQLSRAEQQADMDQVDRYWPIFADALAAARKNAAELRDEAAIAWQLRAERLERAMEALEGRMRSTQSQWDKATWLTILTWANDIRTALTVVPGKCPVCGSPEPELHPISRHSLHHPLCPDPFHAGVAAPEEEGSDAGHHAS